MAVWVAPHVSLIGSLFLVSDSPNRVLAVIKKHEGWGKSFQDLWIDNPDFWNIHVMTDQFPPVNGVGNVCFEFKGKTYVSLGLSKTDFHRIRWVEKLYSPVHDDDDSGEDDEAT